MAGPKRKQHFFPSDPPKETPIHSAPKPKPVLQPRSPAQKGYIRKLTKRLHDILFVTGPAGTGKTYPAVLWAILEYEAGRADKIIITRPNVGAGDDLGYLPGTLIEKMAPWMQPVLDVFKEFYTVPEVEKMIRHEVIEIAPLVFMRGRTLKNAIIIADEMQNATVEQMKMLLTRIGENSVMVITGDIEQHDRPKVYSPTTGEIIREETSGLRDVLDRLERRERLPTIGQVPFMQQGEMPAQPQPRERIGFIRFGKGDVVRHEVIEEVLDLYA